MLGRIPNPDNVDEMFGQLTAGLSLNVDEQSLPLFPMDGQAVRVDPFAGEYFRQDLLGTFMAEMLPPGMPCSGEIELTSSAAAQANEILGARIISPSAIIRYGGWLALKGEGAIPVRPKDEPCSVAILVDNSVHIFGRLSGAGYSPYPLRGEGEAGEIDEEGYFEGEMTTGLVVVLDNVIVCNADGYGQIDDTYEYLSAPLALESLRFYKPYTQITLPEE